MPSAHRPQSFGRLSGTPLRALAAAALLSGCGPGPTEAAAGVLIAAPAIVGLAGLLLWLVWRPLEGGRDYPWRSIARLTALALIGPALVSVVVPHDDIKLETTVLALWAAGTGYLAIAMLVWRVGHAVAPDAAVLLALRVAAVLTFVPGVPLLFSDEMTSWAVCAFYVWIYAGFAGWVPGGLAVLLWLEAGGRALVRRLRRTGPS